MGRTGRVRPRLLSTILTSSHRSTPRSIPPLAPPRWKAHRSHSGSGPPVGRGTCPLRIYAAATIPRPTAADLGSGSRNWLLHFPQFCPPKRRLCAWSIEAHIAMLPKRRPHDLRRQLARSSGSAVGSQPTLGSVPFPFERAAQPVSTRLQNPDLRPWRCRSRSPRGWSCPRARSLQSLPNGRAGRELAENNRHRTGVARYC